MPCAVAWYGVLSRAVCGGLVWCVVSCHVGCSGVWRVITHRASPLHIGQHSRQHRRQHIHSHGASKRRHTAWQWHDMSSSLPSLGVVIAATDLPVCVCVTAIASLSFVCLCRGRRGRHCHGPLPSSIMYMCYRHRGHCYHVHEVSSLPMFRECSLHPVAAPTKTQTHRAVATTHTYRRWGSSSGNDTCVQKE